MKNSSEIMQNWLNTAVINENKGFILLRVITDQRFRAMDNNYFNVRVETPVLLQSYRYQNSIGSCNIFVTDLAQVYSGPDWNGKQDGHFYFRTWLYWMKRVTAGLTVSFSTGSSILLVLTNKKKWQLPSLVWDTVYTSPILTFVISLDKKTKQLTWIKWACVNCQPEQLMFLNESPFDKKTALTFLSFYDRNTRNNGKFHLIVAGTPSLSTICRSHVSTRQVIRGLTKLAVPLLCRLPTLFIMEELATSFNDSHIITHGDRYKPATPNEIPKFYKGNIVLTTTNTGKDPMDWLYDYVGENVMEDIVSLILYYCDPEEQFRLENSLNLMGKPFQVNVWIVVAMTFIAMFIHFKMKSARQSEHHQRSERIDMNNHLFDILSMVLQQGTNKEKHAINILFVTISFVLAFHYEFDITSKLIVPPQAFVRGLLSQLLNDGYKMVLNMNVENEKVPGYVDKLRGFWGRFVNDQLIREGFTGDVIGSMKYWKAFTPKRFQGPEKAVKGGDAVAFTSAHSEYGKDGGTAIALNRKKCHFLSKRYGHQMMYLVITSIMRREYSRRLYRLFYDSGIRKFYTRLYTLSTKRQNQRQMAAAEHKKDERGFAAMKLDLRMFALLTVSASVIALALISFGVELMMKGRENRKGQKGETLVVNVNESAPAAVAKKFSSITLVSIGYVQT